MLSYCIFQVWALKIQIKLRLWVESLRVRYLEYFTYYYLVTTLDYSRLLYDSHNQVSGPICVGKTRQFLSKSDS